MEFNVRETLEWSYSLQSIPQPRIVSLNATEIVVHPGFIATPSKKAKQLNKSRSNPTHKLVRKIFYICIMDFFYFKKWNENIYRKIYANGNYYYVRQARLKKPNIYFLSYVAPEFLICIYEGFSHKIRKGTIKESRRTYKYIFF